MVRVLIGTSVPSCVHRLPQNECNASEDGQRRSGGSEPSNAEQDEETRRSVRNEGISVEFVLAIGA